MCHHCETRISSMSKRCLNTFFEIPAVAYLVMLRPAPSCSPTLMVGTLISKNVEGMRELGTLRKAMSPDRFVSEQETAVMYRQMDIDRDGAVSKSDFQEYMEAPNSFSHSLESSGTSLFICAGVAPYDVS